MGCAGSKKLEDEEAVRHCLDRTRLLADAIRHRYALADSHAAYSRSLRSVGEVLQKFLLPSGPDGLPPPSPVLPLPTQRKGDPLPPFTPSPPPPISAAAATSTATAAAAAAVASIPPGHSHSHSHSGSHIQFHSSDDSDGDSDDMTPFHSDTSSPIHLHPDDAPVDEPSSFVHLNYARNQPPPPYISYEQRPHSPERVQFGYEPQISSSGPAAYHQYGYPYPTQNSNGYYSYPSQSSNIYPYPAQSSNTYPYPAQSSNAYPYPAQSSNAYPFSAQSSNFNPYPDPYMSYGGGVMGGGLMGGGYFGSSSPPPNFPIPGMAAERSSFPSSSQTPPPPPSPPRASTWEFLNPFELHDNYHNAYTPSRSSKELREEEGIPDLEDEENEVVKEAYGDGKSVASTSSAGPSVGEDSNKAPVNKKEAEVSNVAEDVHRKSRSVESTSSSEHDIDLVEKRVVAETSDDRRGMTPLRNYHDVTEVVREIKNQFDRASESVDYVSKMLEVGKFPYQQKNSISKVSARMVCGLPYPSTFKNKELLVFEEDKAMGSGNLSSTLEKLYTWEMKLLDEVKVEEETRQVYDRKREQLRHLIDKGAEAEKIEAVQTNIKKLSTKIRIAIQIVQSISSNINKLRDDELWPQISELIQGFTQMWRLMVECHHIQCQAISEAKNIDSIISGLKHSDDHIETTKKLEMELLNWIANFSSWISTQRNYVKCLNEWLVRCLHYVPEETDDGVPPFSPGRLGAPPVFVICNYWSQSMDRILEKDVMYAMQAFADNVMQIWKQHKLEQRQRMMENGDIDKKLSLMERDEQVMKKAVEAHKKLAIVPAQATEAGSLHSNLKLTFEAMENFTVNTVRAYEELHTRCEEEKERFSREKNRIP